MKTIRRLDDCPVVAAVAEPYFLGLSVRYYLYEDGIPRIEIVSENERGKADAFNYAKQFPKFIPKVRCPLQPLVLEGQLVVPASFTSCWGLKQFGKHRTNHTAVIFYVNDCLESMSRSIEHQALVTRREAQHQVVHWLQNQSIPVVEGPYCDRYADFDAFETEQRSNGAIGLLIKPVAYPYPQKQVQYVPFKRYQMICTRVTETGIGYGLLHNEHLVECGFTTHIPQDLLRQIAHSELPGKVIELDGITQYQNGKIQNATFWRWLLDASIKDFTFEARGVSQKRKQWYDIVIE